jgi:hypothetical protein
MVRLMATTLEKRDGRYFPGVYNKWASLDASDSRQDRIYIRS